MEKLIELLGMVLIAVGAVALARGERPASAGEEREVRAAIAAVADALDRLAARLEPAAPGPPGLPSWAAQALDLEREGKSADEIARALGRPQGEVELVLGLGRLAR